MVSEDRLKAICTGKLKKVSERIFSWEDEKLGRSQDVYSYLSNLEELSPLERNFFERLSDMGKNSKRKRKFNRLLKAIAESNEQEDLKFKNIAQVTASRIGKLSAVNVGNLEYSREGKVFKVGSVDWAVLEDIGHLDIFDIGDIEILFLEAINQQFQDEPNILAVSEILADRIVSHEEDQRKLLAKSVGDFRKEINDIVQKHMKIFKVFLLDEDKISSLSESIKRFVHMERERDLERKRLGLSSEGFLLSRWESKKSKDLLKHFSSFIASFQNSNFDYWAILKVEPLKELTAALLFYCSLRSSVNMKKKLVEAMGEISLPQPSLESQKLLEMVDSQIQ